MMMRDLTLLLVRSLRIISIITGIPSLPLFGLTTGGPVVTVWGWVVVVISSLKVLPSRPRNWLVQFPGEGSIVVTTGISLACANFISTAATINTNYKPDSHKDDQDLVLGYYRPNLNYLNNVPCGRGTTSLVIELYSQRPGATRAASLSSDRTFIDGTSVDVMRQSQWTSPAYVAVIGILLALYRSNASTYMTEEPTMRPCLDRFGTIMAIGVSATLDRFLVLGLFIFFSIQDCERTVASSMGQPVTQIFGHGRREGPNCLDGDDVFKFPSFSASSTRNDSYEDEFAPQSSTLSILKRPTTRPSPSDSEL
ncbi:hypothetical protein F5888DRAFT_1634243 [Russula emetica]|nr:hypothetical protein F5888DRAFT_1634243 [Russula emetica]